MKNLAEFKKFLASNVGNEQVKISSKVIKNVTGETVKENEPATIGLVQSNSFALNRGGKLSFMEFRKASEWTFLNPDEAEWQVVHNAQPNNPNFCHIILTIHKN
jgi:hypothetical protein